MDVGEVPVEVPECPEGSGQIEAQIRQALMGAWQAFRAGIEGTISGLKRAFRLSRCFCRGFKGFATAIGLGLFSHNLVVLAKLNTT